MYFTEVHGSQRVFFLISGLQVMSLEVANRSWEFQTNKAMFCQICSMQFPKIPCDTLTFLLDVCIL